MASCHSSSLQTPMFSYSPYPSYARVSPSNPWRTPLRSRNRFAPSYFQTTPKGRQEAIERERERLDKLADEETRKRDENIPTRGVQGRPRPSQFDTTPQKPKPKPQPPARHPHSTIQSPPTTDERISAASKIQSFYRTLSTIKHTKMQYENLWRDFSFPSRLDFVDSDALVSVEVSEDHTESTEAGEIDSSSTRKLAYTPTNAPLHFYTESLSRLLVALDGVESRGHRTIREKRREVVRQIEGDAALLERRVRRVWDGPSRKNASSSEVEPVAIAQEKGVEGKEEKADAELLSPLLTASECEMNQVEMMLDVDSDERPLPEVEVGDVATITEPEDLEDGPNAHLGMPEAANSNVARALQSDVESFRDRSE